MTDLSHPSNARNAIKRLRDAADRFEVILPKPVVDVLDAEPVLPPARDEVKATAALAIAEAILLPASRRAKVTDGALDAVARAEATVGVRRRAGEIVEAIRVDKIREHREAIVDLFRDALADDFEALSAHAANVPPVIPSVETLTSDTFEAYAESKKAATRIDEALAALAPFAGVPGEAGTIGRGGWQRLAALDVAGPECDVEEIAYALKEVLPKSATSLGWDSVPWYVGAARAGAMFVLADADTRRASAERMAAGREVPTGDGRRRLVY